MSLALQNYSWYLQGHGLERCKGREAFESRNGQLWYAASQARLSAIGQERAYDLR
jgi:hypothetical protein